MAAFWVAVPFQTSLLSPSSGVKTLNLTEEQYFEDVYFKSQLPQPVRQIRGPTFAAQQNNSDQISDLETLRSSLPGSNHTQGNALSR